MRKYVVALVSLVGGASASCASQPKPAPAPDPIPAIPRGAAGDADVRRLVAQIASAKACEQVEHQFRLLQSDDAGKPVNGSVWLRGCQIDPDPHDGARITVDIHASGWTWGQRTQKKVGGTFELHQYVKFDLHAHVAGDVDVAYDPETSVGTLWLTPVGTPVVEMKMLGDVEVDREGVWSQVVGAVGTAVGDNPDAKGRAQAVQEGEQKGAKELARGLSITMNLCNGLSHMMLGRVARGIYGPAGAGETKRAPIEIHPGGVLVFPPVGAPDGMTIDVDTQGPVHVGLACRDQGEAAAAAFLADKPVAPTYLADQMITGTGKLTIGPQRCPVTVIAQAVGPTPVRFDYVRPLLEAEHATMGPLIRCAKKS